MFTGILEPTHLTLILFVALIVLGPKRLPEAGRSIGQGLKEFKSSISGVHGENPPGTGMTDGSDQDKPPAANASS
jgi:sec-independent protein translocase protein TatA